LSPGLKSDFIADKKKGPHKISAYLIEKHHIRTMRGTRVREAFIYKDGIYVSGEDALKKDIREILEEQCSTHYVKEIIEAIKDLTAADRDEFQADPNLININNGVLDIRTKEFTEHNPKHIFFTKLPVNYDQSADCPVIKKYLLEVLDEEQIKLSRSGVAMPYTENISSRKPLSALAKETLGRQRS